MGSIFTFMVTLSVRYKSNDYGKDYEDQGRDHNIGSSCFLSFTSLSFKPVYSTVPFCHFCHLGHLFQAPHIDPKNWHCLFLGTKLAATIMRINFKSIRLIRDDNHTRNVQ